MRTTWSFAVLSCVLMLGCEQRRYVQGPSAPAASARPRLAAAGGAQSLTRVTSDPIDEVSPVVSPDGSTLLVNAITYDTNHAIAQQVLVGVNPAGASGRTLFTSEKSISRGAAWLPDSSGMVFVSNAMGNFNLVRTLSKTPNAALSVVARGDMAPDMDRTSVSPDGKFVTFEMGRNGVKYVGVSGIDGSNFTQLTEGRAPAFSPDGRRISFVRKVGSFDQIFIVNAQNGGELTQLTNDDSDNRAPRWAPNGRYLTFASNRGWNRFAAQGGSAATTWNIYAIRIDGTQLTQLTDGPITSVQPFWAYDTFIYFSSNDAGNFDIWRLKPVGDLAIP